MAEFSEENDLTTLSGLFTSFPVFLITTVLSAVASGILIQSVAQVGSIKGVWRDAFFFLGAICIIMNSIAFIAIVILLFNSLTKDRSAILNRQNHPVTSGLCMAAAVTSIVFGVIALLFTFGQVFVGTPADAVTAAYVMMIIVMIQSVFAIYDSTRNAIATPSVIGEYREALPAAISSGIFGTTAAPSPPTIIGGGVNIPDLSNIFADETTRGGGTATITSAPPPQVQQVPYYPWYPQAPPLYTMMQPAPGISCQPVAAAQPVPIYV